MPENLEALNEEELEIDINSTTLPDNLKGQDRTSIET